MNSSNTQAPIRVLVVDDSSVMRKIISTALGKHPEITVAGFATNGLEAIDAVKTLKPDVVTLDIEMPEMDGLTALREIRKFESRMPIIMFSTLTQKGAQATVMALTRGASDYVEKPGAASTDMGSAFEVLGLELVPKILALAQRSRVASPVREGGFKHRSLSFLQPAAQTPSAMPGRAMGVRFAKAVCIGVSTGGPVALMDLFSQFSAPLTVPVFIVQHIPASFSSLLAARLSTAGEVTVKEGEDGEVAVPGMAYLAPGDFHMTLERKDTSLVIRLNQGPPENSCRPAADVLFRSAAQILGPDLLAVVMTGMGSDGLLGCREVSARHGQIVVQDEESSVIWGMPGAVARDGIAEAQVPLKDLGQEIVSRVSKVKAA